MSNNSTFEHGLRNIGMASVIPGQDLTCHGTKWTFENGWTISIQLGEILYSDGKYEEESGKMVATEAEVGIFDHEGEWVHAPGNDQVFAYLSTDDVARLVAMAANGDRRGIERFRKEG